METTSSIPARIKILRWTARIWGTFIVFFMSSIFIGEAISKGLFYSVDPKHYVMFILIGIAQLGILLAWKWEGLGGLLGIIGVLISDLLHIFWIQNPKLIASLIGSLMWFIPSVIFVYCWYRTRNIPI